MELMPATGAALQASAGQRVMRLSELVTLLRISHDLSVARIGGWPRCSPMRTSGGGGPPHVQRHRIDRVDIQHVAGEPCFLGIDSGSTTTKIVLVDTQGRLVFAHYAGNSGNAIQAAQDGLEQLRA